MVASTSTMSHCIHSPTPALASSTARSTLPTDKSIKVRADPVTAAAWVRTRAAKSCNASAMTYPGSWKLSVCVSAVSASA